MFPNGYKRRFGPGAGTTALPPIADLPGDIPEGRLLANSGRSGQVASRSALPPTADVGVSMSDF